MTTTLARTHSLSECVDGECLTHPMCEACDETGKTYCPTCGEDGGPSGDPTGCPTCEGTGQLPCPTY